MDRTSDSSVGRALDSDTGGSGFEILVAVFVYGNTVTIPSGAETKQFNSRAGRNTCLICDPLRSTLKGPR